MHIDNLDCLGASVRAELEKQITQRKKQAVRQEHCKTKLTSDFDSRLEQQFYYSEILPGIQSKAIIDVELHKKFDLLQKSEYCGLSLPAAHYTPDFLITYRNGQIEAVEVKAKQIRKMQRDYIYRRRLFIELYCRPRGWLFREVIT